jgi:hypothetical protein
MIKTRLRTVLCLAFVAALAPRAPAAAQPAAQNAVTFTETTPLADRAEIIRRMHTPLVASRLPDRGQAIDLSHESFTVYIPTQKPPDGYALLVFIPPWDAGGVPQGWASILDDKGMIFVSAANSGNDQDVRTRRVPLALIAAFNLAKQYNIDPSRVFVGGFSGGSRVAMRVALAYPDVFRGAFLNSGSDPIGDRTGAIPPAPLFKQFQEQSQLFYVFGDNDRNVVSSAHASLRSMDDWCVFNTNEKIMINVGHDLADSASVDTGLSTLLLPVTPDPQKLAACRAHVQSDLDAALQNVRNLVASGDKTGARQTLNALDAKFGGLATSDTLTLDKQVP